MFADVLFPRRCPSCGARAPWLCEGCLASVRWVEACCDRCGRPGPVSASSCPDCRRLRPAFGRARAAAVYAGPVRDALIAFKLRGERRAASAMAAAMSRVAAGVEGDVVTAVPSTPRVRAERLFDPAAELARAVGRGLGLPYRRLLHKVRETADQTTLGRADRRANLRDAFRAAAASPPERVLLVDDILTTGATADACARALRQIGVAQVDVLTFARAI